MKESFAGITVPEGDPQGMRNAGATMSGMAGAMEGVRMELQGMPGVLSSWRGPASVSYAGSCLTNGSAASGAAEAFDTSSFMLRDYADKLEHAQHQARRAIADAREATVRMHRAEADIEDARSRYAGGSLLYDFASARIIAAGVTGMPAPDAFADQNAATNTMNEAQAQEARARRDLDEARDDLDRARAQGQRAEQDARAAVELAASGLELAGATAFALGRPGAPSVGTSGGGGSPLLGFLASGWSGFGVDVAAGGVKAAGFIRSNDRVSGYVRRSGTEVAPYLRGNSSAPAWAGYSRWASGISTGFSAVSGAAQEVKADTKRSDLTGAERAGRVGGAAVNGAGWSLAGAAAGESAGAWAGGTGGAAIGSIVPGVGTAIGGTVGAAGGAIVGGIAGSGLGGIVADHTRDFTADAGQRVVDGVNHGWDATAPARHWVGDRASDAAHGVDRAWDSTAGVRHGIGGAIDAVTPW